MDKLQKVLAVCGFIFLALGVLLIFSAPKVGKLRIIACDVGQGDGLLIITPKGNQFLVDGGPGNKILTCLSEHMPFWDRTVEAVLNTHPQQDHLEGLVSVLSQYRVKTVFTTGVPYKTDLYLSWKDALRESAPRIIVPNAGKRMVFDSLTFDFLWPREGDEWVWQKEPPAEVNITSIIFRLTYGNFCAYFTGDIPKEILARVIDKKCQVLKVAHHGSKTGTNQEIVDEVSPEAAIISVGAKNRYGHPAPQTLEMLTSKAVKIYRNDTNGIIEVDSDGAGYSIQTKN